MITRDELTEFIYDTLGRDLLKKAAAIDPVPNSVQIRGNEKVTRVALGVSASPQFIEAAIAAHAEYLLVHHGLYDGWIVRGRFEAYEHRLRHIFTHNLTLAGFHYALDTHPEIGNSAEIIKKLGARRLPQPYFDGWGWIAELPEAIPIQVLIDQCHRLFRHEVYAVTTGPSLVRRIGVCTGGARPRGETFFEIIDSKVDVHLTGEINESGPYAAEVGGFSYLACGHYATEVFGVQALGDKIKTHFGDKVAVEFIDIPNTV